MDVGIPWKLDCLLTLEVGISPDEELERRLLEVDGEEVRDRSRDWYGSRGEGEVGGCDIVIEFPIVLMIETRL